MGQIPDCFMLAQLPWLSWNWATQQQIMPWYICCVLKLFFNQFFSCLFTGLIFKANLFLSLNGIVLFSGNFFSLLYLEMKTYYFLTIKALHWLRESGILIRFVELWPTRSKDLVAFHHAFIIASVYNKGNRKMWFPMAFCGSLFF